MRIVFFGTGDIALPSFRYLCSSSKFEVVAVVTQPDRPAGRKLELQSSQIKQLALSENIPVLQPERLRSTEGVAALKKFPADVFVVMAYGQILPRSVLEMPRLACLNLHASLLPKHRGASPIHAALLAGDQETGITIMYMAEGLDTGDCILQQRLRIRRRETVGILHDRLAELAPQALDEALEIFINNPEKIPRTIQNEALASYAPKLDRESARIDWTRPAREVERLIRGMNPWPGAWTEAGGSGNAATSALKIRSAIISKKLTGPAGQILPPYHDMITVACGEGALLLGQVQLPGRRWMHSSELLRGHLIKPGMSFY
ncbi:MAG: methionyl-tRNA formyltransferase [Chthoniobacterales bacterium]